MEILIIFVMMGLIGWIWFAGTYNP